jgi:SynChlorMet cassette radical SAM/SPASM protein ScmE
MNINPKKHGNSLNAPHRQVMQTPRVMDIAITNQCNLRCHYCSHFTSSGDVGQDLPTEEWLAFFEELCRNTVLRVILQGGEPFFRKDLELIIAGIVKNRMRFSILSNGTLITDEWAVFIKSTGRCDQVQVSIDGSKLETHESFRGPGTFEKAVSGLKTLLRHEIPVTVRVTIHRQNIDDLENIAGFLLDELKLPGFSTNSASFIGLCRQNHEQVQLSIEEHNMAMQTLDKLARQYKGRITATAGPLADTLQWFKMEQSRLQGKNLTSSSGCLTACGGIFNTLAVRADGIMIPCVQLSHIELGKINRDDLKEVWQKHPELARLRTRDRILLNTFSFCQDCVYTPYCTGNCPALAYTMTGCDQHPSPDACLKRFLEAGGRLPALAQN